MGRYYLGNYTNHFINELTTIISEYRNRAGNCYNSDHRVDVEPNGRVYVSKRVYSNKYVVNCNLAYGDLLI